MSKLTERAVFNQLHEHMMANGIYPFLQSAYRQHHSTETALLRVMNDILLKMNSQHVTLLVLLDLSAAFDTVSHDVLLDRLHNDVGLRGNALNWFYSYLSQRSQRVSIHGTLSNYFDLDCGVPQGSCLGPLLFVVYASKLFTIIKKHLPNVHCFADDTQLYLSFKSDDKSSLDEAISAMNRCISDLRNWMIRDRLMINDDKTELILIGTRQQLGKINDVCNISVGDYDIYPSSSVRNLGAWFDNKLSTSTHVTKICKAAFYQPHNIRRIKKYSGTPPYDHPVYKTTSLLRPYSFKPNVKNIDSFSYFEDPVNATTSLLRPGFYGPTVVALTGFHCIYLAIRY